MISVKFFASVRERLGRANVDLELQAGSTVAEVLAQVEGITGVSLAGQHL